MYEKAAEKAPFEDFSLDAAERAEVISEFLEGLKQ
jgi:hypothetical protein